MYCSLSYNRQDNCEALMALSLGIVGLPNVGKSSLFNALTESAAAEAQNYPFTTIDPNVGVVPVADERLQALALVSHSANIVPATIEFVDIAGLVRGANKGEGLGNQFLANIREVDAIVQVARVFKNSEVIHVEGDPNPTRDFEIIETELIYKDLEIVERRWDKIRKEARAGLKHAKELEPPLTALHTALGAGIAARDVVASVSERERELMSAEVKDMALLSGKPLLVLLNVSSIGDIGNIEVVLKEKGVEFIVVDVAEELSAIGMSADEREELGMTDSALNSLTRAAYELLGLASFFTSGEPETRAWTINQGAKAPEAAGKIHSDFEQKFIRADTIHWEKFIEMDGWKNAREKGLVRSEGKDYVVADGDVMEIRHG